MLALVTVITVLLAVDVFGRTESWAYDIVSPTDSDLGDKLTQMGIDGYELVFARRAADASASTSTARYGMIFKRRLGFFEAALAKRQKAEGEAAFQKELRQREMQPKRQ